MPKIKPMFVCRTNVFSSTCSVRDFFLCVSNRVSILSTKNAVPVRDFSPSAPIPYFRHQKHSHIQNPPVWPKTQRQGLQNHTKSFTRLPPNTRVRRKMLNITKLTALCSNSIENRKSSIANLEVEDPPMAGSAVRLAESIATAPQIYLRLAVDFPPPAPHELSANSRLISAGASGQGSVMRIFGNIIGSSRGDSYCLAAPGCHSHFEDCF